MLLRLVVIFATLCELAGLMLSVWAHEARWAGWIGGGGALLLLVTGLHRFAVMEAGMRKSARRVLNLHGD